MVKVLFVCLGNICRSPSAEGVFRHHVERSGLDGSVEIASAGTAAYHAGEAPDPRSQAAARARGIEIGHQRARQVRRSDFDDFDLIVAMDRDNHANLSRLCPPGAGHKLHLMLDFAPELGHRNVPDPYYGGPRGFEDVLDMLDAAARGLLNHIRDHHLEPA